MLIFIIRVREKVILMHGGREKVIWAGGYKKNGAGGCGPRKSKTILNLCFVNLNFLTASPSVKHSVKAIQECE